MKSVHNTRPPVVLILILVAAAFLTGVFRAFRSADAAGRISTKISFNDQRVEATALTPTPVPTEADTDTPAQIAPAVIPASADTSGIIALAFVIVITILVGATWGVGKSSQKKIPTR